MKANGKRGKMRIKDQEGSSSVTACMLENLRKNELKKGKAL